MITLRKASDRGMSKLDWLDSRHTFSFGGYFDSKQNGFSVLRVINDDWIAGGRGFGSHPHRDMEIVTYVLRGTVEHRDSIGNRTVIPAGDLQRMTAGTGIVHSEINPSPSERLHLLQIWILPEHSGLEPGYEQKTLGDMTKGRLALVASPKGGDGALTIHQDTSLYIGAIASGQSAQQKIAPARRAYVHVSRGKVSLNGTPLGEGDGAKIVDQSSLKFDATQDAEILLFDLP